MTSVLFAIGDLSSLVWIIVRKEPIVCGADDSTGTHALVADFTIPGGLGAPGGSVVWH